MTGLVRRYSFAYDVIMSLRDTNLRPNMWHLEEASTQTDMRLSIILLMLVNYTDKGYDHTICLIYKHF